MYTVSQITKKNIEHVIGVPMNSIKSLTVSQERSLVEERINKKLVFSTKKHVGITGRGNPLLARKKIRTMEYVDNRLLDILNIR